MIIKEDNKEPPVIVGITGASGSRLAESLIDKLLNLLIPVIAIASSPAKMVWQSEMTESFGATIERWSSSSYFKLHSNGDFLAPISSGTFPTRGMAIVPCSMATTAAISIGLADNLIRRSADVCLKERRPLVLVPRESPLTAIHLENMTKLANLGAVILPPEPAFYLHPKSVDEVIDFISERAIYALGITDVLPDNLQYHP
jgi:4-hydroxy-3-polyprenylbenzoate decarboxylase